LQCKPRWLLLGSEVVTGTSRDQARDEGAEHGLARWRALCTSGKKPARAAASTHIVLELVKRSAEQTGTIAATATLIRRWP
jgi:hypothetical protein